jgi:hypothetical protein
MDVFISYASADKHIAKKLSADLRAMGIDVWIDSDGIRPGDEWFSTTLRAVRETRNFLALISRHTLSSNHFGSELATALASAKNSLEVRNIIPIIVEDSVEPPSFLSQFQAIDASNSKKYGNALKKLETIVRETKHNERSKDLARPSTRELEEIVAEREMFYRKEIALDNVVNQWRILSQLSAMFFLATLISTFVYILVSSKNSEIFILIWPVITTFVGAVLGYYARHGRASIKKPKEADSD